MAGSRAICIDIGSTFTKGALFDLAGADSRVVAQHQVPTTVEDLPRGFGAVFDGLWHAALEREPSLSPDDVMLRFSSSARGGLRVAALGLVPDLTLTVARMAAASAGARIVASFAYELTPEDVARLAKLAPDIILLTGGTDGGAERQNLANARTLAAARLPATIIYAGNHTLAHRISDLLSACHLVVTENVMPEIGVTQVEPARQAIRQVFLERIVEGRGLAALVQRVGAPPKPTPLAVFELVQALAAFAPEWSDVAVVDLGGATTDFYSHTESFQGGASVVLRGVVEPRLTRSVEGDLGLRVSAQALYESARDLIVSELQRTGADAAAFDRHLGTVTRCPDHLPSSPAELHFDQILAQAGAALAAVRHAGTMRAVVTPGGKVWVQKGKDLRRIQRVIGTGGFLARHADAGLFARLFAEAAHRGAEAEEVRLLPEQPAYYVDQRHLMPVLGCLAAERPQEAAHLLSNHLALTA